MRDWRLVNHHRTIESPTGGGIACPKRAFTDLGCDIHRENINIESLRSECGMWLHGSGASDFSSRLFATRASSEQNGCLELC